MQPSPRRRTNGGASRGAIRGLRRRDFFAGSRYILPRRPRLVCCLALVSRCGVALAYGLLICCVWARGASMRETSMGRDGRGSGFWAKAFSSPPAAAYTQNHIYIMNNSKHAFTINQPDNQLLKCYNI
jgi:hypothetical protein